MDKILKISLSAAALIIAFSTAYYFVYYLPQKERVESGREQMIRQNCFNNAEISAKDLIKTKVDLPGGYEYKEAAEKGLYLKNDFETSYELCLSKNGLKK